MSGATSRCDSPGTHAKDAGTAYEMLSTRTVPVSGALVIIYVTSGGHIVEKDQGFGTGPGASGLPSRSSPPTATLTDARAGGEPFSLEVRAARDLDRILRALRHGGVIEGEGVGRGPRWGHGGGRGEHPRDSRNVHGLAESRPDRRLKRHVDRSLRRRRLDHGGGRRDREHLERRLRDRLRPGDPGPSLGSDPSVGGPGP